MSTLARNKHTPVDASGGAVAMTLPTGGAVLAGDEVSVEKFDSSSNAVSVTGNIRGASGVTVNLLLLHEAMTLRFDGSSWWPVNSGAPGDSLNLAYAPIGSVGTPVTVAPDGMLVIG